MRERRLYVEGPLRVGEEIALPAPSARHVNQVLRLRPEDRITLFDGTGGEYLATLTEVHRTSVRALIESHEAVERESALSITIGQGISRGERMDLVIQKAVELGVQHIAPVITQRTVVKLDAERSKRRRAHWQSIANHSCEQSGRNRVVTIGEIQPLTDWIGTLVSGLRLTLSPTSGDTLRDIEWSGESVTLLIGPEGGLNENEIELAKKAQFRPVQLGPRVLRTETAALAALAALQMHWGDFS